MLYKLTEFENISGWHVLCNEGIGTVANSWYFPARVLGISPAEFIEWLIENYKPDDIHWNKEKCLFFYGWKNQDQMRKFKNFINAEARKKNFQI